MVFQADKQIEYKDKYDITIDAVKKMPASSTIRTNADPTAVVTLIRSRWPLVLQYCDQFAKQPGHDIQATKKVLDFALAFAHANALYNAYCAPPDDLPVVVEEAIKLRNKLIKVLQAMLELEIIHVAPEKMPHPTRAYENIISTLLDLKAIFEENAKLIKDKSPISPDQLKKASAYASYIQEVVAVKANHSKHVAEAMDIRDRYFTLVLNTWDEIRRAATYTRWKEKDYDELFPSIYTTRAPSKPKAAASCQKAAQDEEKTPAASPVAKPAGPVLPGEPSSDPFA